MDKKDVKKIGNIIIWNNLIGFFVFVIVFIINLIKMLEGNGSLNITEGWVYAIFINGVMMFINVVCGEKMVVEALKNNNGVEEDEEIDAETLKAIEKLEPKLEEFKNEKNKKH